MKNKIYLLTALLSFIAANVWAQSVPQSFNFSGNMTSRGIPFNFTCTPTYPMHIQIRDLSPTGPVIYSESFTNTKIINGYFSLTVGTGTVLSGSFSAISAPGAKYCSASFYSPDPITPVISTTPQLISSVPTALVAGKSMQWDNSGNNMYNTNNGNLGIGNPLPVEKLDVSGAVRVGNTTSANDGAIRYTGSDFEGRKAGAWVSLTGAGGGGSSPWTVNGANIYSGNVGNVGIGITSPSDKLQVTGRVSHMNFNTGDNYTLRTNFGGAQLPPIYSNVKAAVRAEASGGNGVLGYSSNATGIMGISETSSGGYFKSTSAAAIFADGKVGIGTSAPYEMLDVNGGMVLGYTNGQSIAGTMRYNGQLQDFEGYVGGQTPGWKSFSVWNQAGGNIYTGTPRVGIGASSPAAKLEVFTNSSVAFPQLLLAEAISGSYSRLKMANAQSGSSTWMLSGLNTTTTVNDVFNLNHSSLGDIMRVTGDGKVGIGTGNSGGFLEVKGSSTASTPQLKLTENANGGYARLTFGNAVNTNTVYTVSALNTGTAANDRLNFFHTTAGDVLQITGDGKTIINGPLAPGGNAGTVGQVLQSNGSNAAPTWVTPAATPGIYLRKTFIPQNNNPYAVMTTTATVPVPELDMNFSLPSAGKGLIDIRLITAISPLIVFSTPYSSVVLDIKINGITVDSKEVYLDADATNTVSETIDWHTMIDVPQGNNTISVAVHKGMTDAYNVSLYASGPRYSYMTAVVAPQ